MGDEIYHGHVTKLDGTHVPLTSDEARKIWDACEAAKKTRAETMPSTVAALSTICSGKERLRELGWRDVIYCPKDRTSFAVIQYGSTGIFYATYHGEWPKGTLYCCNYFNHPEGAMFKPIAELTPDEKATLDDCMEHDRIMAEREMAAFGPTPNGGDRNGE
jgi:hypothetical protein